MASHNAHVTLWRDQREEQPSRDRALSLRRRVIRSGGRVTYSSEFHHELSAHRRYSRSLEAPAAVQHADAASPCD